MDLRVQKTKKNIRDAFLELRAQKPLERITVKELSERAMINKATFYTHYKDVYDLQEQLEDEAVKEAINNSTFRPESLYTDPREGTMELMRSMIAQKDVFNTIFMNGREHYYSDKIDRNIKDFIYQKYPEFRDNVKVNALLTILTYGCFSAYIKYNGTAQDVVIDVIGDANERLKSLYEEYAK